MEANSHWCAIFSDYDDRSSDHEPDEHEIMEMALEADRLNDRMFDD